MLIRMEEGHCGLVLLKMRGATVQLWVFLNMICLLYLIFGKINNRIYNRIIGISIKEYYKFIIERGNEG